MNHTSRVRIRRGLLLLIGLVSTFLVVFSSSYSTGIQINQEKFSPSNLFPSKLSELLKEAKNENHTSKTLGKDGKPKATFYMLITQFTEISPYVKSIRSVESRFNNKYKYDWVFAHQEELPDIVNSTIRKYCSGNVHFSRIPEGDPYYAIPETLNSEEVKAALAKFKSKQIPYGDSLTFRMKNRFQSYGFQFLPVMENYDYFCNVEVDTEFQCDIKHDFFRFMYDNDMTYGFTHAPPEPVRTTKSFWKTAQRLITENDDIVHPSGLLRFLIDDAKKAYSKCTFSSNLEVGDLSFFRSPEYKKIFDFMDTEDGFFGDRWLDSNIHTLAVTLLLPRTKVFWIDNTGYIDADARQVCPVDPEKRKEYSCSCDPTKDYSWTRNSCLRRFFQISDLPLPEGVANIPNFKPRYKKQFSKINDERNPTLMKLNYMSSEEMESFFQ